MVGWCARMRSGDRRSCASRKSIGSPVPAGPAADGGRTEFHRRLLPQRSLPAASATVRARARGAGMVEAVGEGVREPRVGQRVAYASPPTCAPRRAATCPLTASWCCPTASADEQAAAMMLKGMTAQYLLRRTYRAVRPDHPVPCAAGGVGLIACQWARHLGATVIGTVGSDAKAERQGTAALTSSATIARTWSRGYARSPAARACPWSMTRSGRQPSSAPRLPGAARHAGELRAIIGQDPPVDLGILARRLAVYHAADADDLHGPAD